MSVEEARTRLLYERIMSLEKELGKAKEEAEKNLYEKAFLHPDHKSMDECLTFYDGCHCTVETLKHNIERAQDAEKERDKLRMDLFDLEAQIRGVRAELGMQKKKTEDALNEVELLRAGIL